MTKRSRKPRVNDAPSPSKMHNVPRTYLERVEAARRYADADKSDPFAFMRAMTHMKNGLCRFTTDGNDAFYTADAKLEDRRIYLGEGKVLEYQATVYTNRARP